MVRTNQCVMRPRQLPADGGLFPSTQDCVCVGEVLHWTKPKFLNRDVTQYLAFKTIKKITNKHFSQPPSAYR